MKWQAARGKKESNVERTERTRETVHSTFWHNDDASNMSPTDIPVGISQSANYRPEAHVFPFLYCIGLTWIPFHRTVFSFPPFPFFFILILVLLILVLLFRDPSFRGNAEFAFASTPPSRFSIS